MSRRDPSALLRAARRLGIATFTQVDAELHDDRRTVIFYGYDTSGECRVTSMTLPEPVDDAFDHQHWAREMKIALLATEILRRAEEWK